MKTLVAVCIFQAPFIVQLLTNMLVLLSQISYLDEQVHELLQPTECISQTGSMAIGLKIYMLS